MASSKIKKLFRLLLIIVLPAIRSAAQQPSLILPVSSTNKLQSMVVSHDEKYAVSCDLDGVVKCWQTADGKLIQQFFLHETGTDVTITHDNKYLIAASISNKISIWSLDEGYLYKTLDNHKTAISILKISPDGKWLASGDQDGTIIIWDVSTWQAVQEYKTGGGYTAEIRFAHNSKWLCVAIENVLYVMEPSKPEILFKLHDHSQKIHDLDISSDNKFILTSSWDNSAKIWDAGTGKQLNTFSGHSNGVFNGKFSPDNKTIITCAQDSTIRIWDLKTARTIKVLKGHEDWVTKLQFSADGKKIISTSFDNTAFIWAYPSGELLHRLTKHSDDLYYIYVFRKNGKMLLGSYDNDISKWDVNTGKDDFFFGIHNETISNTTISNGGTYVAVGYRDGVIKMINLSNGKIDLNIDGHDNWCTGIAFNRNDSLLYTAGTDNRVKVWELPVGEKITEVEGNSGWIDANVSLSKNNEYLLSSGGNTFSVYNMITNKGWRYKAKGGLFNQPRISNTGKYVADASEGTIYLYSSDSGKLVLQFDITENYPPAILFSDDDKHIICADKEIKFFETDARGNESPKAKTIPGLFIKDLCMLSDNKMLIAADSNLRLSFINLQTLKVEKELNLDTTHFFKSENRFFGDIYFSPDDKYFVAAQGKSFGLWSALTGKWVGKYIGDDLKFIPSSDRFFVNNNGNLDIYDATTGKFLLKHFIAGKTDYIVMDSSGRFDGTEMARKELYFTCGKEVIELEALKDQLWVPGLAEKILKGEKIEARTLSDLNICGLTPVVSFTEGEKDFMFSVLPRRGGIGQLVLSVNNIEVKRYTPNELVKVKQGYTLTIKRETLQPFMAKSVKNQVQLKAYTQDNTISARSIGLDEDTTKISTTPPNLYAVMVGVSDYKGDELDLKYAAKDANDMSLALSIAAKKLLNSDKKEHVYVYDFTTDSKTGKTPGKKAIQNAFADIAKKAAANDILLIFFAGHGVMEGEKKQFYFLTADASKVSAADAVKDVGISTNELTEWIRPDKIKAQKRVLIFDACNSGQAIKDFVKLGGTDQQYMSARDDEKAQQIKAIDKLNEKSGLFILSASASNQSAYEMGRFSQGLLTYSLLKAIKEQPDILNNGKYLDLSKWFNAAKESVAELSKESGARQEPQMVSNTNFTIGIVDEEVVAKIVLPVEKPLFTASNFQNSDEAIADDDLELSKAINLQLNDMATRSADNKIVYVTASNSPDAWSVSGRYEVKGNTITVKANLKKKREVVHRFEITGTKDKLKELADMVVTRATLLAQ